MPLTATDVRRTVDDSRTPLACGCFLEQIAALLGRRVTPGQAAKTGTDHVYRMTSRSPKLRKRGLSPFFVCPTIVVAFHDDGLAVVLSIRSFCCLVKALVPNRSASLPRMSGRIAPFSCGPI